jgi:mannose-6-phosphate isomerase-like protein (cupin superfamily)
MRGQQADLRALQQRLEATEVELAAMGYRVERAVTHPGTLISQQMFDEETLILILHGEMLSRSGDQELVLGAGSRLRVPSGVPYTLQVVGEVSVYWIHARRREQPDAQEAEASRE